MLQASKRLLDACNAARQQGTPFPAIWRQIIEPDPIVAGPPVQQMQDGQPVLDVPLRTGQRLRFGRDSFILTYNFILP